MSKKARKSKPIAERPPDAAKTRRQVAEERVAQAAQSHGELSPEAGRRLVHELEVHQIELEMQNEELGQARVELEAARDRYFEIYDLAPVGYCTLSAQGLILEANLNAATILGVPRGELVGQPISRFIVQEDQDRYHRLRQQIFATSEPQACELRMRQKDGTTFWAHLATTAVEDAGGAPSFRVVLSVITERKKAEEALRASNAQLQAEISSRQRVEEDLRQSLEKAEHSRRAMLSVLEDQRKIEKELGQSHSLLTAALESTVDGILVVDLHGRVVSFNRKFLELWRISAALATERDDRKLRQSVLAQLEDPAAFVAKVEELYGHQDASSWDELRLRDGRVIERYSQPQWLKERIVGRVWSFRDVTERKRAAEALSASEARYRLLAENVSDVIWVQDIEDGAIRFVSPSDERLRGFAAEEVLGHGLASVVTPASLEYLRSVIPGRLERFKQGQTEFFTDEIEQICKDGSTVWTEITSRLAVNQATGRLEAMGVTRDISERRRADERLRESEARYRLLAEHSEDFVSVHDREERRIYVSPSYFRATGWTPADLEGSPWNTRLHPDDLPTIQAAREANRSGQATTIEHRIRCRDGSWLWVEARSKPVLGEDGAVQQIIIWSRDITERKQADEALRASEAKFRVLAEEVPHLVWMCRPDGGNIYFNQRWVDYTGMTLEESYGHGWNKPFHPDDQQRAWDAWKLATETGGTYDLECRLRRADGAYRWFIIRGLPMRDAAGQVLSWFGTCTDFHDRKEVEESLRASEERFRVVAETANDVVYEWDLEQRVEWLGNVDALLGYEPGEFPRTLDGWVASLHPDDVERTKAAMQAQMERGVAFVAEYRVRCKNGVYCWWSARGTVVRTPDGKPSRWIGSVTDITESKRADEQLRESEERLRSAMEGSQTALWDWNIETGEVRRNEVWATMLGYTLQEIDFSVKQWTDYIHPEDQAAAMQSIQDHLAGRSHRHEIEYRMRTKDGHYEWILDRAMIVRRGPQGQPLRMSGIMTRVTERRRAEEALRESNELFALFMQHSPIFAYIKEVTPTESRVMKASENFQDMVGMRGSEVVGKTMQELFPAELAATITSDDWAVVSGGEVLRKDEDLKGRNYTTIKFPIAQSGRNLVAGYTIDITERRRAEFVRETLHALAQSLSEAGTPTEAARNIFAAADRFWKWDSGALDVIWPGNEVAVSLLRLDLVDGIRRDVSGSLPSQAAPTPRMLRVMAQGPELILRTPEQMNASDSMPFGDRTRLSASLMSVPIRLHGQTVGVLSIQSYTSDAFTRDDLAILQSLADQCGGALERLHAEEALHESEIKFRALIERAPDGIVLVSAQGVMTFASPSARRMFGLGLDAPIEVDPNASTHPEDLPRVLAVLEEILRDPARVRSLEYRFRHLDGRWVWIESVFSNLLGVPEVNAIVINFRVIHDRKLAEQALQASEERWRAYVDQVADGLCVHDFTGRLLAVNQQACDSLGYSREEFMAMTVLDFEVDYDLATAQAIWSTVRPGEPITASGHQRRKDGTTFPVEIRFGCFDLEGKRCYLALARDVSDRERAQAELRESLLFRREAEKIGRIGAWKVNPATDYCFWTEGVYEIVEAPLDYRPGLTDALKFYDADGIPVLREALNQAMTAGTPFVVEVGVTTLSGKHIWTEVRGLGRVDEGNESFIMGTFQDITERKLADESLATERNLLRTLVDNLPDLIFTKDLQAKVVLSNTAAERFLGFTRTQLAAKSVFEVNPPELASAYHEDDMRVLRDGETVANREEQIRDHAGDLHWHLTTKAPLRDPDGRIAGLVAICRNIDDRKRSDEIVNFLANASAGNPDEPFFKSLARYLAQSLGMEFVCIDRLDGDGLTAHTVAVWCDGRFEDNVSYALKDTPCGDVVGQTVCCFPASVCQFFPRDQVLQDLRAQSYVGVTLWGHAGQPIGLIAVIGRTPMADRALAEATLKLVAVRAAGEMERQMAEDTLRTSEQKFFKTFHSSPVAMSITTLSEGRYVDANDEFLKMLERDRTEVVGHTSLELKVWTDPTLRASIVARLKDQVALHNVELEFSTKSGRIRHVLWSGEQVVIGGEDCLLGSALDITERKLAEAGLASSQAELKAVYEHAPVMMCVVNPDRSVLYANTAFTEFTGAGEDELKKGRACGVFGCINALEDPRGCGFGANCEQCALRLAMKDTFETGLGHHNIEHRTVLVRDGLQREVTLLGSTALIRTEEQSRLLLCLHDITRRKQADDELRRSLDEKTALLKEVHHRVKNNLQIVASLLNLQAGRVQNHETRDVLEDTRNRVRSMALLHEVLYSSGNLAKVNFAAYVEELCVQLRRSFGPVAARVKLETKISRVSLSLEQSVPCGLIINELVSNAVKHAFPGGREGAVTVEMRHMANQEILLRVSDDGAGLPAGLDLAASPTLGLRLITSLAGQLNGRWQVEEPVGGRGTSILVAFPAPPEKGTDV